MGAGIGALTGGLVRAGGRSDEEFAQVVNNAMSDGFRQGKEKAFLEVVSEPGFAANLVSTMDPESQVSVISKTLESLNPEARKAIMRQFGDKGWLTRMFGG